MRAFWADRTIKAKLLLGIGVILAIFAASSALVLVFINVLASNTDYSVEKVFPARQLALRTQTALIEADDVGAYYVMDRDPRNWPGYLKTFDADVAHVRSAIPQLREAAETPEERAEVDAFGAWFDQYVAADEHGFERKRAGDYAGGIHEFTGFDTTKGTGMIATLVDATTRRTTAAKRQIEVSSQAAIIASVAGAIVAIVAGALIAFSLGGTISRRLKSVTEAIEEVVREDIPLLSGAMGRFAKGDLSARVSSHREPAVVTGKDETALLAMSYNKLLGGVDAFGTELTATGIALTTVIGDVKATVDAAADGDFTRRLRSEAHDGVFRELSENLNRLMDVVGRTVGEIKDVADVVSTSAREISAGNNDLSRRTEEQAASLEETAASMEELTATVRQNADSAKQANSLAIGASDIATKGGAVVSEVVATMAAINESGKKIVDIIAVIDGIAFQTNILALNAAVEAARAGEQGRGFAVVAGEVRTLAQRSAAAAKEIKVLIGDSVDKTSAGTLLVGRAGTTMEEIVTSVKRVTEIMAAIAEASLEQGSGIEQVNQAVSQMDKVTQQNAALVEEIAASALALEERARGLVDFVSVFKVAHDSRAGVGTPAGGGVARRSVPPARPPAALKAPREPVAAARPAAAAEPPSNDDWTSF